MVSPITDLHHHSNHTHVVVGHSVNDSPNQTYGWYSYSPSYSQMARALARVRVGRCPVRSSIRQDHGKVLIGVYAFAVVVNAA